MSVLPVGRPCTRLCCMLMLRACWVHSRNGLLCRAGGQPAVGEVPAAALPDHPRQRAGVHHQRHCRYGPAIVTVGVC